MACTIRIALGLIIHLVHCWTDVDSCLPAELQPASSQALGASGSKVLDGIQESVAEGHLIPGLPGRTPNSTFALNIEMWFRSLPFPDRIRAAAELGFDWVEFWGWQGRDLKAIKEACAETGVKVAQFIGWGFVPGLNDPENHDDFERTIEASCGAAHELGTTMLTVVGGNDPARDDPGADARQHRVGSRTGCRHGG